MTLANTARPRPPTEPTPRASSAAPPFSPHPEESAVLALGRGYVLAAG